MKNSYWKVFWRADPPTRGIEAARTHNRQRVCTRVFPSLSRARTFAGRVPEGLRPEGSLETLTDSIKSVGWENLVGDPNEVHQVLASLDLPLYLTTNYDSCMAEALAILGKEPGREICLWNDALYGLPSLFEDDPTYEPTAESPLVYHLFGSDEVADVTGAGDTVISVFTAARAAGGSWREAAELANLAGGLVVMKRGTATVTRHEMVHALRDGWSD